MQPVHDLFFWVSELPTSIAIRESLLFCPVPDGGARRQHVPVRRADRDDGSAASGDREHEYAVLGTPEAAVSVADAGDGDELGHRAHPRVLRPDALLRQHLLLDEDAGDGARGHQRNGVPLHHVQLRADVGLRGPRHRLEPSCQVRLGWCCGRSSSSPDG